MGPAIYHSAINISTFDIENFRNQLHRNYLTFNCSYTYCIWICCISMVHAEVLRVCGKNNFTAFWEGEKSIPKPNSVWAWTHNRATANREGVLVRLCSIPQGILQRPLEGKVLNNVAPARVTSVRTYQWKSADKKQAIESVVTNLRWHVFNQFINKFRVEAITFIDATKPKHSPRANSWILTVP